MTTSATATCPADLIEAARAGDESAWHELVRRYAPLIWSVCRRYRLTETATEDVAGMVWLRLVDGLATVREPAALPGWLATVTRRECLAVLRRRNRETPLGDLETVASVEPATDAWLLDEERRIALREAISRLSEKDRKLMSMLLTDPPAGYAEISATLGIPIGSIGPTRQRCLDRIRQFPAVARLLTIPEVRFSHPGRPTGPGSHRPRAPRGCGSRSELPASAAAPR